VEQLGKLLEEVTGEKRLLAEDSEEHCDDYADGHGSNQEELGKRKTGKPQHDEANCDKD
jgi:hypothetical protein